MKNASQSSQASASRPVTSLSTVSASCKNHSLMELENLPADSTVIRFASPKKEQPSPARPRDLKMGRAVTAKVSIKSPTAASPRGSSLHTATAESPRGSSVHMKKLILKLKGSPKKTSSSPTRPIASPIASPIATAVSSSLREKKSRRTKWSPSGRCLTEDAQREVEQFVTKTLEKGIEGIKEEFDSLEKSCPNPTEIRGFRENMKLNRYKDVTCLDATRVLLRLNVPPDTNYIHANRVEMADLNHVFIATQAPLAETIADFWRLCYQETASSIVMLCSFMEAFGRKCVPYWPLKERNSETFGCITVTCLKIITSETLLTYDLEMYRVEQAKDSRRPIKLYRVQNWPDRGVPNTGRTIINVLRCIDKEKPCVIHCSAGIGRTGAAIAIEAAIQRLTQGKPVKVKEIVEEVRCKRAHSVQTELQYLFIYFTLLDYIRYKLPKYSKTVHSFRLAFKREVADEMG